jgi:hypothetical protein
VNKLAPSVLDDIVLLGLDFGLEDLESRSYSGRGMYDKKCLGFFFGSGSAVALGAALAAIAKDLEESESVADADQASIIYAMISCAREDSMGCDRVIYFPGVVSE